MVTLNDFIGKKVTISIRDYDDVVGVLKNTDNGGYIIEVEDEETNEVSTRFIPEKDNVIYVDVNGRFY
jgi:small nuclear ribonucleoprotein (snRNP)-like protein